MFTSASSNEVERCRRTEDSVRSGEPLAVENRVYLFTREFSLDELVFNKVRLESKSQSLTQTCGTVISCVEPGNNSVHVPEFKTETDHLLHRFARQPVARTFGQKDVADLGRVGDSLEQADPHLSDEPTVVFNGQIGPLPFATRSLPETFLEVGAQRGAFEDLIVEVPHDEGI